MSGYSEAFAPIQAHYAAQVQAATFGHLALKKNTTYRGKVLFCKSCYESGSLRLIDMQIPGADDSPWLYDAIYDYLYKFNSLEDGAVYQIHVTLRNYRFWGTPFKIHSL